MNPSQEPAPPGGASPAQQPDGPPSPGEHGWSAPGRWPFSSAPRRRPWRRSLAAGALTALAVAAAGVPLGLLWSWIAPSVPVVRTRQGDIVVSDPSPEQFIAADGSFTLLGFGFGVLAAIAAWLVVRRHRGPALVVGVVLGALGAAAIAWQVGRRFGLAEFVRWQEAAAAGATFDRPPDLHAHGTLLVPAFAAVIVCTLLAGWSNDPDLDVPGARPGYGHDLPTGPHPDQYGAYELTPGAPAQLDPAQLNAAQLNAAQLSSGSPGEPGQTTAPAPPGSGPAAPPRG